MIKFLFLFLLLYLFYRLIRLLLSPAVPGKVVPKECRQTLAVHQDPVCKVYLTEAESVVETHNGRLYYFCSGRCSEKFKEQSDHKI